MTPLALSPEVIAKRRAYLAKRRWPRDDIERKHDAFQLFGGMGSPGYITCDGRILIDADEIWEAPGLREANSDDEVIAMLTVGAKNTGIVELLGLIPPKPADAVVCPLCNGSRWWHLPGAKRGAEPIVCLLCRGRGWATQAMIDARPDLAPFR